MNVNHVWSHGKAKQNTNDKNFNEFCHYHGSIKKKKYMLYIYETYVKIKKEILNVF